MGTATARHLFGDRIDEILARWQPTGGTAWYLTDHLGTVRDLVDDAGDLLNTITYDSFGKIISQTDAAEGDRFTYTGREYDAELDLYYYRARFYDPNLGRFGTTSSKNRPRRMAGASCSRIPYSHSQVVEQLRNDCPLPKYPTVLRSF